MSIGVSVLHEDAAILDDLAYAIGRCDGIHLAGLGEIKGDAVVLASPSSLPDHHPGGLLVLSNGDPLADARAGFAAGATGIVRWPDDAGRLAQSLAAAALGSAAFARAGALISVCSARGGAGATTVACLLAASIEDALLIDLAGGGQLAFADEDAGTSLPRALASPVPDVVAKLVEPHASGRALLCRPGELVAGQARATLIAAARRIASAVVMDSPPSGDFLGASAVFLVCAPDLASMRAARVWLERVPAAHVVLNRAGRTGIRARHVTKALGRAPVAVMPADRRLARASDVGRFPKRLPRKIRSFVHALRAEAGL